MPIHLCYIYFQSGSGEQSQGLISEGFEHNRYDGDEIYEATEEHNATLSASATKTSESSEDVHVVRMIEPSIFKIFK